MQSRIIVVLETIEQGDFFKMESIVIEHDTIGKVLDMINHEIDDEVMAVEQENEGINRMVENTVGIPEIASEIESILQKSKNDENVTPDFRINITVKDHCVEDIKVTMQHKRPRGE